MKKLFITSILFVFAIQSYCQNFTSPISVTSTSFPLAHFISSAGTAPTIKLTSNQYDQGGILTSTYSWEIANHAGTHAYYIYDRTAAAYRFYINTSGYVGIGTCNPAYKLDVYGTIRAKEVIVDQYGVPDYVFKKDYKLRTISELDAYIKENGHLPEVKSAEELEKDGAKQSEMNNTLLKKVEELTLYIIELNKKVGELEKEKSEHTVNAGN